MWFVLNGKSSNHSRVDIVKSNHIDSSAFSSQFRNHIVERTNSRDIVSIRRDAPPCNRINMRKWRCWGSPEKTDTIVGYIIDYGRILCRNEDIILRNSNKKR